MKFTEKRKRKVNVFIAELKAKRKEILDAGKDTADETNLPDENGEYCTTWGCTDNADLPIFLKAGEDFVDDEEERR